MNGKNLMTVLQSERDMFVDYRNERPKSKLTPNQIKLIDDFIEWIVIDPPEWEPYN